jgi:hypothetical protein
MEMSQVTRAGLTELSALTSGQSSARIAIHEGITSRG